MIRPRRRVPQVEQNRVRLRIGLAIETHRAAVMPCEVAAHDALAHFIEQLAPGAWREFDAVAIGFADGPERLAVRDADGARFGSKSERGDAE